MQYSTSSAEAERKAAVLPQEEKKHTIKTSALGQYLYLEIENITTLCKGFWGLQNSSSD